MPIDPAGRLYALSDTRFGTVALHLVACLCLVVFISVQWPYRDGFDFWEWIGDILRLGATMAIPVYLNLYRWSRMTA